MHDSPSSQAHLQIWQIFGTMRPSGRRGSLISPDTAHLSSLNPLQQRQVRKKDAILQAPSRTHRTESDIEQVAQGPASTADTIASTPVLHGRDDTTSSDWQMGDILHCVHVAVSLNEDPNAEGIVSTNFGNVCVKPRPAIVAAVYDIALIVLPTYTSGGRGFERRPLEYKRTVLSVMRASAPMSNQSPDRSPELEEIYVNRGPWAPRSGSYVNLLEHYYVDYRWNIASSGSLKASSATKLREEFVAAVRLADLHPSQQRQQPLTAVPVSHERPRSLDTTLKGLSRAGTSSQRSQLSRQVPVAQSLGKRKRTLDDRPNPPEQRLFQRQRIDQDPHDMRFNRESASQAMLHKSQHSDTRNMNYGN